MDDDGTSNIHLCQVSSADGLNILTEAFAALCLAWTIFCGYDFFIKIQRSRREVIAQGGSDHIKTYYVVLCTIVMILASLVVITQLIVAIFCHSNSGYWSIVHATTINVCLYALNQIVVLIIFIRRLYDVFKGTLYEYPKSYYLFILILFLLLFGCVVLFVVFFQISLKIAFPLAIVCMIIYFLLSIFTLILFYRGLFKVTFAFCFNFCISISCIACCVILIKRNKGKKSNPIQ